MRDMHPDILELLAQRATEGLNDEDAARLSTLLTEHQVDDTEAFDLPSVALGAQAVGTVLASEIAIGRTRRPGAVTDPLEARAVDLGIDIGRALAIRFEHDAAIVPATCPFGLEFIGARGEA